MRFERGMGPRYPPGMFKRRLFRCFRTSPEVIRLAVMLYIRFPLSLWKVKGVLQGRGIGMSHEAVRFW